MSDQPQYVPGVIVEHWISDDGKLVMDIEARKDSRGPGAIPYGTNVRCWLRTEGQGWDITQTFLKQMGLRPGYPWPPSGGQWTPEDWGDVLSALHATGALCGRGVDIKVKRGASSTFTDPVPRAGRKRMRSASMGRFLDRFRGDDLPDDLPEDLPPLDEEEETGAPMGEEDLPF